ncbi:hypothetical protein A2U01_0068195, partial [Trifolium medium]|nr:hypothetical protein [Trifolium medium]
GVGELGQEPKRGEELVGEEEEELEDSSSS